jgi:hypothetical protein
MYVKLLYIFTFVKYIAKLNTENHPVIKEEPWIAKCWREFTRTVNIYGFYNNLPFYICDTYYNNLLINISINKKAMNSEVTTLIH